MLFLFLSRANASLGLFVLSWCQVVSESNDISANKELFKLLVKVEVSAYSLVAKYVPKGSYNGLYDAVNQVLVTPKVCFCLLMTTQTV